MPWVFSEPIRPRCSPRAHVSLCLVCFLHAVLSAGFLLCFAKRCPCFCGKSDGRGGMGLELTVGPECAGRAQDCSCWLGPGQPPVKRGVQGKAGVAMTALGWESVKRCSEFVYGGKGRKNAEPWNCSHKMPICLRRRLFSVWASQVHCSGGHLPLEGWNKQQVRVGGEGDHDSLAPGDKQRAATSSGEMALSSPSPPPSALVTGKGTALLSLPWHSQAGDTQQDP